MLSLTQKTAAVILSSIVTFPITLLLLIVSYLRRWIVTEVPDLQVCPPDRVTVLINNAALNKSLELARAMHRGGHRVILVEVESHTQWVAARFSSAVSRFYRVPDPLIDYNGYQRTMVEICTKEKVKVFMPVSAVHSAYHDALLGSYLQRYGIQSLIFGSDLTRDLDDKYSFMQKCNALQIKTPLTFLMLRREEIVKFKFNKYEGMRFILKRSSGESPPRRRIIILDHKMSEDDISDTIGDLQIGPQDAYVLQEYIRGMEVATYALALDGEIRAFCCTPSKSIITEYTEVEVPAALEFTKNLAAELRLTGHICFDFIIPETHPHEVLPLECNPRCHTAICLFAGHPWLAEAYYPTKRGLQSSLDDEEYFNGRARPPVFPLRPINGRKPVYWIGHALYDVLFGSRDTMKFLKLVATGRDGFFSWKDPLPFMVLYHLQFPIEVVERFRVGVDWNKANISTAKLWL